jgi:protein phosphatase
MTGKKNEDRYAVSAYRVGEDRPLPAVVALLADGVGGNRAGEVAAEMAVEIISQHLADSDATAPVEILEQAFQAANQAIFTRSQQFPDYQGMGTTCVCAWVIGDRLYAAWAGDSRLYLVRNGTIQRLSIDHTFVQEAIDQGIITPEEARSAPARHVIHRYLGMPRPVELDFRLRLEHAQGDQQAEANQGFSILPGDRLLLCSDGLTDMVEEAEILPLLLHAPLEQALSDLIDLANQRGGLDNITIIGLQVPWGGNLPTVRVVQVDDETGEVIIHSDRSKRLSRGCLVLAALLVLGMILAVSGWWVIDRLQSTPAASVTTASPLPAEPSRSATAMVPPHGNTLATTPALQSTPTPQAATATLTPWP